MKSATGHETTAIFRGAHSFGEQSNEISKEGYEVNVTDFTTLVGTMGGGFLLGTRSLVKLLKKIIKIAPVTVGLFIAALAYSQYQGSIYMELAIFQKLLHQGITV